MDLPLTKKSKMKPTKSKMKPTSSSERGVCYFSHVPHGFFEKEMREFLTQFGTVTNLRIGKCLCDTFRDIKNTGSISCYFF